MALGLRCGDRTLNDVTNDRGIYMRRVRQRWPGANLYKSGCWVLGMVSGGNGAVECLRVYQKSKGGSYRLSA